MWRIGIATGNVKNGRHSSSINTLNISNVLPAHTVKFKLAGENFQIISGVAVNIDENDEVVVAYREGHTPHKVLSILSRTKNNSWMIGLAEYLAYSMIMGATSVCVLLYISNPGLLEVSVFGFLPLSIAAFLLHKAIMVFVAARRIKMLIKS